MVSHDIVKEFRTLAGKLKDLAAKAGHKQIEINPKKKTPLLNYDMQKNDYYVRQIKATLIQLKDKQRYLPKLITYDRNNSEPVKKIRYLVSELNLDDVKLLEKKSEAIKALTAKLSVPKQVGLCVPKNIPNEIRDEIVSDIREMNKCYNAECFRSVVIICGRLIEVALHRKYFDATGNDILEKNPGIGLGKLIAKLKEKEVVLEPGLTQQIHLINQVRVFSVHKKQESFYPSREQAQAMMLYTIDVLKKMFV